MMKITLIGAAGGEVAGSCYSIQTKQARILVDLCPTVHPLTALLRTLSVQILALLAFR
jgi:hypothetical protein